MTAAPLRRVDPIGDALYQALQDEEEAWQRVLDVQRVLDAAWDRYRQAERRSARVSKAATRHINRIRQQRHAEGRKAG